MERSGAISPGILVLTTGLSKPFRRLDKYSAMLQELERHTEKNNPDRGDTQRSVSVYRDIAVSEKSVEKLWKNHEHFHFVFSLCLGTLCSNKKAARACVANFN